jgi:hypothetical protein
MAKKAKVGIGATKDVHFKRPVSHNEVQAYQSAPGYFSGGNACNVRVRIGDTFGTAR